MEGDTLGVKEKILSIDPVTKFFTRLLKFPAGIKTTETLIHDFGEQLLILEGELIDIVKREKFCAGFYAWSTPGMNMLLTISQEGVSHLSLDIIGEDF